MTTALQRQMPIGAELLEGGAHFRVWAPKRDRVEAFFEDGSAVELDAEPGGYFSRWMPGIVDGTRYRYRLDGGPDLFPDPASRFQPEGPHGPSQIVDGSLYAWRSPEWQGVELPGCVIYEMHIGTFTTEGTWNAARQHLAELAETGINLIEVMPVAEFPGTFGWGYDGVDLFAPTHLYGRPDDFRAFVDEAHLHRIGVILDVVYNHLGPDGNYLTAYSDDYFTDRYQNEWGLPINFDGPNSAAVREFFITNARYWIQEFRLDGLRLDATQQIFDASSVHILADIAREARRAAGARSIVIVGENEPQEARLVRRGERGCGLDAVWNDDFHHSARVAMTGRNEAYYSDYNGTPQELISAVKWGFLYQGQYYHWQKQRRGTPALDLSPAAFVAFIQNHDQIANSAYGHRLHQMTTWGRYKAIVALLLLSPSTPMLFQGQEFCASSPFLYFADHRPDLARAVEEGRAEFLDQFPGIRHTHTEFAMGEPHDRQTFERCRIDHRERATHAPMLALHRDLIHLRRTDPVFRRQRSDWMHGAVIGAEAFILRFLGGENGDRLIVVNLGRDLRLVPAPEPLLAPPEGACWNVLWSSEDPRYGGTANPPVGKLGVWNISGHSAVVLNEKPNSV